MTNKSTGDDVSDVIKCIYCDGILEGWDQHVCVDSLKLRRQAAEARAVKAEQALEESRKATAYFSNVGGIEQNKVDALQAQVDALRKERDEFAAEHIKRGLAATARCERMEKAIQAIVDIGDWDDSAGKMYWMGRHSQYAEAKAIAEQALADGGGGDEP